MLLSWERPCSDLFGVVQLLLLLDRHFSAWLVPVSGEGRRMAMAAQVSTATGLLVVLSFVREGAGRMAMTTRGVSGPGSW